MATAATLPPPSAEVPQLVPERLYRFTVEQYERMIDLGILQSGEPYELLEGWLVRKMTQKPPHATAVDYVREAVQQLLPATWRLREQKPIRLAASEPEPDLVVVPGPISRFQERHPTPVDIALTVEVADSSLAEDRGWKGRLYAQARLTPYWIINLVEAQVEVYSEPKGGKASVYRHRQDYGITESVPLMIAGQSLGLIPVRDLLPKRK